MYLWDFASINPFHIYYLTSYTLQAWYKNMYILHIVTDRQTNYNNYSEKEWKQNIKQQNYIIVQLTCSITENNATNTFPLSVIKKHSSTVSLLFNGGLSFNGSFRLSMARCKGNTRPLRNTTTGVATIAFTRIHSIGDLNYKKII